MAAMTTIALVAVGAAVGAYSAVKQGQFQSYMAEAQAKEMELQMEAMKTQRAGERVDESNQQLGRARQLDALFKEQKVMMASSGLMGGSFNAIQAGDLSKYSQEQNMSGVYSSVKESNAASQLDSLKHQIATTRASGSFAKKMGYINAVGGLLQAGGSAGMSVGTTTK